MSFLNKKLSEYKFGFSNTKKKFGINYWRFFFIGTEVVTECEQMFCIEFQMINPWQSPDRIHLGFKSRPKIREEDLQYALAGTDSALNLQTESEISPSYCSMRVGKVGTGAKQLCLYFPVRDIIFGHKPFSIQIGNNVMSDSALKGTITLSEEDGSYKPEYLCNQGTASWDLIYEVENGFGTGFEGDVNWFPCGLQTKFTGKITFDGVDYRVRRDTCRGYSEKFWSQTLCDPWFHISANSLTSEITGKTLFNSAFAVQGISDNKISFMGKFENQEIVFKGNNANTKFEVAWDCVQMPQAQNPDMNLLHWSCSFTSKSWVVDIDIFCKVKDLFNRNIELPDGKRKVTSMLEGISQSGEIKLYKCNGLVLEQIEHAKLSNVVCEFGHKEEFEF